MTQDNAVQSLVLWKSWEQAGVDPSRVVNAAFSKEDSHGVLTFVRCL